MHKCIYFHLYRERENILTCGLLQMIFMIFVCNLEEYNLTSGSRKWPENSQFGQIVRVFLLENREISWEVTKPNVWTMYAREHHLAPILYRQIIQRIRSTKIISSTNSYNKNMINVQINKTTTLISVLRQDSRDEIQGFVTTFYQRLFWLFFK